MCYRVECRSCGKYTWGGCGKHLKNVYGSIAEGKHCLCRSWPGLVVPPQSQPSATSSDQPSQPATSAQGNGNHQILEAAKDAGL